MSPQASVAANTLDLVHPLEDRAGSEGSRVALGQTGAGRYLRVIYVPDAAPDSVFVMTAYDLGPKAKQHSVVAGRGRDNDKLNGLPTWMG
jgi:hypothetical protein